MEPDCQKFQSGLTSKKNHHKNLMLNFFFIKNMHTQNPTNQETKNFKQNCKFSLQMQEKEKNTHTCNVFVMVNLASTCA
jgi:hypothetical protein